MEKKFPTRTTRFFVLAAAMDRAGFGDRNDRAGRLVTARKRLRRILFPVGAPDVDTTPTGDQSDAYAASDSGVELATAGA